MGSQSSASKGLQNHVGRENLEEGENSMEELMLVKVMVNKDHLEAETKMEGI